MDESQSRGSTTQPRQAVATLRPGALAVLVAAAMGALAAMPAPAQAQAVAAEHARLAFQYPAQPLLDALRAFGRQTQYQVLFDDALVDGRQAPALAGSFTPREALERLLAGSGLSAISARPGTFTLTAVPRPAASGPGDSTLATVVVTGTAERSGTTDGSGSYAPAGPSSTATGLAMTLHETPQTVSVLTRQQMDDFNLGTLQDMAKATPGLIAKNESTTEQISTFYARGFIVDRISVDGLPLDVTNFNIGNVSADLVMYDRVEVVRGATGLLEGAGSPSAGINLVRKRPTAEPLLHLSAGAGSWARKQFSIDASRVLNDAGTLRGRVVGAWRDGNSFVDVTSNRNGTLYGILEADLAPSTTWAVGAHTQRARTDGLFEGIPTYADGRHMQLPRSTYLGVPDSFLKRDTDAFFTDLEHRFANGWTMKAAATHLKGTSQTRLSANNRIAGSDTVFEQTESGWGYGTRQSVADLRARGPVQWFGREHELVVGVSDRKEDTTAGQTWAGGGGRLLDIGNWDANAHRLTGAAPANPMLWARGTREKGVYGAGRFQVADPLHLVLGGRFGWYTQDTTGWHTGPATWKRSLDASAEFVPYAGLTYALDGRHAVYASLTEVFQPQSSIDVNGNTLDPLTGTNYEVGIKGDYFGGALQASAAVFRIKQRNRAVRDEANCPSSGSIACSRAAGEVRSDGVDLQLFGSLLPGWQLAAGYTYVNAIYTHDAVASNIGQRLNTDEPRHLFKLFTSLRLPGGLNRWSVHGSVQAQSRIYRSETGYFTAQGGQAIVGVGAAYKVDERLQLQLSVDNLFDRSYYTDLGYSWSGGSARYGSPRSVMLTARYSL